MEELKTNYKDDVLDTSKNTRRKYNMIQNPDGTVSFEDVTQYSQQGDEYGAKEVNELTSAVNELNSNRYKLSIYTTTCEAKADTSVIGGFYGTLSIDSDVISDASYIIPFECTKVDELGFIGVVSPYASRKTQPINYWSVNAPKAGTYAIGFLIIKEI